MSEFEKGDVVIWQAGSTWSRHDVWGTVLRVTPKGPVFARGPGDTEIEFRGGRGVRKPTAAEMKRRMWIKRRPGQSVSGVPLEVSTIYFGLGTRAIERPSSIDIAKVDSPEKCRKAAAELLAIATWSRRGGTRSRSHDRRCR